MKKKQKQFEELDALITKFKQTRLYKDYKTSNKGKNIPLNPDSLKAFVQLLNSEGKELFHYKSPIPFFEINKIQKYVGYIFLNLKVPTQKN